MNILLTVDSSEDRPLPQGQTFAGFRFKLSNSVGASAMSEVTTEVSWTFADAKPGVYTASVCAVDTQGQQMSAPVMTQIIVPEDGTPGTFKAPTGLSYKLF